MDGFDFCAMKFWTGLALMAAGALAFVAKVIFRHDSVGPFWEEEDSDD